MLSLDVIGQSVMLVVRPEAFRSMMIRVVGRHMRDTRRPPERRVYVKQSQVALRVISVVSIGTNGRFCDRTSIVVHCFLRLEAYILPKPTNENQHPCTKETGLSNQM